MGDADLCKCGHPKDEHNYGVTSCDCGCPWFTPAQPATEDESNPCNCPPGAFITHTCQTAPPAFEVPDLRDETGRWIFGEEAACQFIARTAWPWEATENRDSWAPRIGNEPEFGRKELAAARRRLDEAAKVLGLTAADADLAAGIERVLGEHRHILPLQVGFSQWEANGCGCREPIDNPAMAGDYGEAERIHRAHVASQVIAYLHRTGAEE